MASPINAASPCLPRVGESSVNAGAAWVAHVSTTTSASTSGGSDNSQHKKATGPRFFASAVELREIINALIGMSDLPDGAAMAAVVAAASAPKSVSAGGGAGTGGGSGSGGSGPGAAAGTTGGSTAANVGGGSAGGVGVKLACSLAVLTIGLSDAASSLDMESRVSKCILVRRIGNHKGIGEAGAERESFYIAPDLSFLERHIFRLAGRSRVSIACIGAIRFTHHSRMLALR